MNMYSCTYLYIYVYTYILTYMSSLIVGSAEQTIYIWVYEYDTYVHIHIWVYEYDICVYLYTYIDLHVVIHRGVCRADYIYMGI